MCQVCAQEWEQAQGVALASLTQQDADVKRELRRQQVANITSSVSTMVATGASLLGSAAGGLAATTLRGGAALAVGVDSGARAALEPALRGGTCVPTVSLGRTINDDPGSLELRSARSNAEDYIAAAHQLEEARRHHLPPSIGNTIGTYDAENIDHEVWHEVEHSSDQWYEYCEQRLENLDSRVCLLESDMTEQKAKVYDMTPKKDHGEVDNDGSD